ncbi:hypothetical protein PVAP13_1KG297905 [Panicum virgatum]|uniref:Uncharacterized protein n=1 Tax=Panicum virgatum TaxID=38727 RepID=A0A8T0XU97_PANVG|nr:hypothetical protein PVAP13_1KG297905 [Panicum virgatum]
MWLIAWHGSSHRADLWHLRRRLELLPQHHLDPGPNPSSSHGSHRLARPPPITSFIHKHVGRTPGAVARIT